MQMQKIATRIFVIASVAFGIIGILLVLNGPDREGASDFNILLRNLLFITAFIILPSFALSIAGKYLSDK